MRRIRTHDIHDLEPDADLLGHRRLQLYTLRLDTK